VPAVPGTQTRSVGWAGSTNGRTWCARVTVPALQAAYVAVLYVTTVVAGRPSSALPEDTGFALTVLAAAVAALTLEPLRVWLRRRLPEPPQDRLARLARSAVEAGDLAEVLQSTARLLQEGLAAASVEIRPVAAGAPPIVARATALLGDPAGVEEIPLARSGHLWGRLRVPLPPDAHMLPRDQALLAEVAEHIATMLQTAALRNALRTVAEAGARIIDLRRSRRRIVRPARGPAPDRARHPRRRAAASGRVGGAPRAGALPRQDRPYLHDLERLIRVDPWSGSWDELPWTRAAREAGDARSAMEARSRRQGRR
jgi:hypothetical protein